MVANSRLPGLLLVTILWLAQTAPSAVHAQILLRSGRLAPAEIEAIDGATRTHWERAEQFLAQQQWNEAVDALRRGFEGEAGRFVPLAADGDSQEGGFTTFVPVRQVAHLRLVGWKQRAPIALEQYRSLTDALAADWLAKGIATRDRSLLTRMVEQAYASRAAEEALRTLGEMALSRGQHVAARHYFEQLHPQLTVSPAAARELKIPSGLSWWLVLRKQNLDALWPRVEKWLATADQEPPERLLFPDPKAPLADAWARLVLVSILEGSPERAELELSILRRLAPEAEGQLAGRKGTWVALLEAMALESRDWPAAVAANDWPTFAGNAARNRLVAAKEIDLALKPRWAVPLPKLKAEKELLGVGKPRVGEDAQALLSYHPIVNDNTVLLRTDAIGQSFVAALDLATGNAKWRIDYPRSDRPDPAAGAAGNEINDAHAGLVRHLGVARYTGHVAGEQAFFRMGASVTLLSARKIALPLAKDQGWLLGLDLRSQGKPLEGFPIYPESAAWGFEGAPLTSGGDLYVLQARRDSAHTHSYVTCYELTTTPRLTDGDPDARPTGKVRWRSRIASAETLGGGEIDELAHNLLTLHEETLYANTNRGAVAALDRQSGEVRWITRYPRAAFDAADDDPRDETFLRDLNPCLIHRELVITAPADCSRIFALHAGTGRLVWALPAGVASDAQHVLGVSGDYLILSGDYLYFVDVWTGRLVTQFPAPILSGSPKAPPNPRGYGRGVVSADRIYWPTRERLYVFENHVEKQGPRFEPKLAKVIDLAPRGVTGGNLLLTGGTLLIATSDQLFAITAE